MSDVASSSSDTFYGGTGEDRLYGGSGNDIVWGGADSDWLEGQDGFDTLYGGSGIDMILLDTDSRFARATSNMLETFNGHYGNNGPNDAADDNATDILLIEGLATVDNVSIGQVNYSVSLPNERSHLAIDYNGRLILSRWRDFSSLSDPNGKPLVEQIRISGLGGDDSIQFVNAPTAIGIIPLDTSDLVERSDDWVAVIDGGPGDDTLRGTGARDRIDGGSGSDTIYGLDGDDQLWGDGGPSIGQMTDLDVIYAGQGDDDVLGGQGNNRLYAWTDNPRLGLDSLNLTESQAIAGFVATGMVDGSTGVANSPTTPNAWSLDVVKPLPANGKLTQDGSSRCCPQRASKRSPCACPILSTIAAQAT